MVDKFGNVIMSNGIKAIVGENDIGLTIKGFLRREKGVSTRLIRKVVTGNGKLLLNGKEARFVDKIKVGDEIELVYPEELSEFVPQDIPIDVLYEDEDIIAINKQPGYVVHPTKGHSDETIANGLMKYMIEKGENYKIRFISRLDMNTSGLLMVGKNAHAQTSFTKQNSNNEVYKGYVAIVCGRLEGEGRIDLPIALEEEGSVKRAVKDDGQPSITEYRSEKIFEIDGCEYTLVRLRLLTGRTHQIRVHLSHIGYPILGDSLYGEESHLIARQALHAEILLFNHPKTEIPMEIKAPLPDDIAAVQIKGANTRK